jgi:peptidoglycan hydrolase-like protein with peptidoglycan-binding domain
MSLLRRGLSGEPVKLLQSKLGVNSDGEFGPETEKALRKYQQENGLVADGIAGPITLAHMNLFQLVQLRIGSSGELVERLQAALGLNVDGQYGSGTAEEVKSFQKKKKMPADGVAGPETLSKLAPFKEFTADVVKSSRVKVGKSKSKSVWETVTPFFK